MDIFDHLFIFALAIGGPVYDLATNSAQRMRNESRTSAQRMRLYRKLIMYELLMVGIAAVLWLSHGREFSDLGFTAHFDRRFWLAMVLGGLVLGVMIAVQSMLLRTPKGIADTRAHIERVAPFMPRSARELRGLLLVALAAGICEEIVYRGYIFWYGREFLGDGVGATIALVVLAAIVFMMAHSYQGKAGMPQVLIVGLVMGGLFVLGRSLWPLILLHIGMDAYGGAVALRVCQEDDGETGSEEESNG